MFDVKEAISETKTTMGFGESMASLPYTDFENSPALWSVQSRYVISEMEPLSNEVMSVLTAFTVVMSSAEVLPNENGTYCGLWMYIVHSKEG